MLEVSSEDKTFLIPLVEEWITKIDENNKRIGMRLPAGLTEI
jgi:ribosomal 30S subunit maturation factor RimM